LPFGVLPVTYIAEQCYCEHRVHLWLKAPSSMVSIPRKLESRGGSSLALRRAADSGLAFHARAAELSCPVVDKSLRKLVRSTPSLVLTESPFTALFDGLPVAGIPDTVHFENAIARCLLDYKVTDSNQLQMSHRVQLQLYGWLLQEARFKLADTLMVSVLVPNASAAAFDELDETGRQQMARTLHHRARALVEDSPERKNWYLKKFQLTDGFWVRLRIFRYDRREATRELRFFAPYWKGERAAIPSSNARKCQVCLYNSIASCTKAVVPFEDTEA